MCESCWRDEYDAVQIDTPAVRECARLIAAVYDNHAVGGGLHVELDDWNIDGDAPITRYTGHDHERTAEEIATEEACAAALNALTIPERASALALYDGYWALPE